MRLDRTCLLPARTQGKVSELAPFFWYLPSSREKDLVEQICQYHLQLVTIAEERASTRCIELVFEQENPCEES